MVKFILTTQNTPVGFYPPGKSHPNPSALPPPTKKILLSTIKPGNDQAAWLPNS